MKYSKQISKRQLLRLMLLAILYPATSQAARAASLLEELQEQSPNPFEIDLTKNPYKQRLLATQEN